MSPASDLPELAFASAEAWERWLHEHHADAAGVWLVFAKKGSGIASVTYEQAVDAALCYGWIDGQVRRLDERRYLQRFTPRRARSTWSKTNRRRVEELVAAGRMRPAGLAEVERARADGRWDAAYDGAREAAVPDDLRAALDAEPAAAAFFETLSSANRYAILWRVQTARTPATRARRIGELVAMLAERRTIH